MIELRNIHKSFGGQKVLKGIDLRIESGETVVLLGLSGSGKTTTLKLINGLVKPDKGEVLFQGQNIVDADLLQLRKQMGYAIQHAGLFPHYSVFENVAVVPRLLKWSEEKVKSRVEELLLQLGLPASEYSHRLPAELSGGQRQRVGLARALAADPPVLLMDEPFGALDPITRQAVRKEFLLLEELRDKTLVLVTHDVQEAFEMGDRIAIMYEGAIIQLDSGANILNNPANDFVREFIAAELLSLQLKEQGLYDQLNSRLLKGQLLPDDLKSKWDD